MKKITTSKLEQYKVLDVPIKDEVQYEWVMRAVRKLRGSVQEDGEEGKVSPAMAAISKALPDRVKSYEQQQYPFGQPNFKEWADSLTEEKVEKELEEIQQAEELVDRLQTFERHRTDAIKRNLRAQNLKQKAFVDILHLDKTHVSHLRNGRKPFMLEVVCRLHDKLKIPYEDLIPPVKVLENTSSR